MSEAALSRISNLLRDESDLQKIDELRRQFQKEKSSIDMKLSTATQDQIDFIFSNLTRLQDSVDKLSLVKRNIEKIDTIYDDSITNVAEYDTLRNITSVHQTMIQVQNLYTDIANFRKFLDHISSMIESELSIVSEDILYQLVNIYRIHFNVTQVRNFAEYMEVEASQLSDDVQLIVQKIVQPVRKVIRLFDELLKEICITATEAAKDGNSSLVFKLIKILQYENKEDVKATLQERLGLISKEGMRTLNYSEYRREPRNYMKFFYSKLKESIKDTFSRCVNHFEDKMDVYDSLGWLREELEFTIQTFGPMFPESWAVGDFIEKTYYNHLHKFTMDMIATNPPAEDLMRILDYDNYHSEMMATLHEGDKSKKTQRSILGEELKSSVLEDYMRVIDTKMFEWNDTLMKNETTYFLERSVEPDVVPHHQVIEDLDDYDHPYVREETKDIYVLADYKTSLQMLKDHADVAAKSGYGKVLVEVIEHWCQCYNKRIENYTKLVDQEVGNFMALYGNDKLLIKESKLKRLFRFRANAEEELDLENMTDEEKTAISKPGLEDYLTALGNTYEINSDRLQDKFMPNYMNKVHSLYTERIEQAIMSTILPSTDLNAVVVRAHADMIVNDTIPILCRVFTKDWYVDSDYEAEQGKSMSQLMMSLICEDGLPAVQQWGTYDLHFITLTVMLDNFIKAYLRVGYNNILHGDGKKIDPHATKKYKMFSEAITRDVEVFYGELDKHFSRKDAMLLVKTLSAIEFLSDMATFENPFEEIPPFWEQEILPVFADCSVEYVRGILLCRKDIDSKRVPQLMNELLKIQRNFEPTEEMTQVQTLSHFTYE